MRRPIWSENRSRNPSWRSCGNTAGPCSARTGAATGGAIEPVQNRNKTSFPRRRESRRVLRALAPDALDARLRGHDDGDGSLVVKATVSKTCGDPCGLKTEARIHIL